MTRQWMAEWIWGGQVESPRNEWRWFRQTFDVPQELEDTQLRISADSRYVLYVNGTQVGRGPVRSWPAEQFYDTYEIGHLLRPGRKNAIAVLVIHFGVSNFYYLRGRGGLIAELTIDDKGTGRKLLTATDATWKTMKSDGQFTGSPRMSCQQGFAEVIDASKWDEEWIQPDYDDSDWASAESIGAVGTGPWKSLVPRDIPFLTEEKVYPSRIQSIRKVKAPSWTAAIDLRAAFMPDTANHANQVNYSGYIATKLIMKEAAHVSIGFPTGARTGKVWVDGVKCEQWYGVLPERYCDLELTAGEHFILADITANDHGGSFHFAIDSRGEFELVSPLAGEHPTETPIAIIGPFHETMDIDYIEKPPLNLQQPDYLAAAGIANVKELQPFAAWAKPLSAALYCEHDVMGSNIWLPEAINGNVTPDLIRGITASPDAAVIPLAEGYDTELLIDFGKEWSGFIGFELEAEAGTTIDLYGLEYVRDDFRQHTYGLDNTIGYVAKGGRQHYLSPVRRGFRYLVMTIRGAVKPVKLFEVYVNQSNYPVTEAGAFQSSDPLLNQIWEISRHTTKLCMEDTFVDCPAYEQVFWVGDSRNEALVNYYVFGSLDIVKRCLNLVPGSKDMTSLYVNQVPSAWNSVIPNWTFFWVIACEEYVEHTGDQAFAASIWPAVQHTLTHYLEKLDGSGLLNMKGWNLLDWAPIDQPGDGIVTHQNLFLAKSLRKAVELAETAGAASEAAGFKEAAQALTEAINTHLWDEERQAYLDCIHADGRRSDNFSMQTQVVAVLCEVAEAERMERIQSYLLNPPQSFVQIGSPFMSFFYYEALVQTGNYEHMLADIRKNYGFMIEHDATTCWEMYANFTENRANADLLSRSHCHAWSAAPGYFLGTSVLGVTRTGEGWSHAAIKPQPCGLSWARGKVPLPQGGLIEVSWRVEDSVMKLDVSAPANIELDIQLPEGMTGKISVVTTEAANGAAW
ncbi:family 78 glycoside hydrolase catalytic domain [Paenibacillus mendelii]|uniref:Family 78 glycoside hydrolase catalytic domain n=1 Tax=Paenibacillus mendelii TaxID=206163 RepID=A0ABV6JJ29_9BACL|nr:family 78 glycoside hydrolase catalytic domain [Paenibacillus mendelii]MCQ6557729.1 glycoside hydrolase family 78 protein [Paenibacillus mendelii]